jgi:hypothetical protein
MRQTYAFTLCVICGLLPREHYRSSDYGTYGYKDDGDEFHNFTAPDGYVMGPAPRQLGPEPAFVYGEPLSARDAEVLSEMVATRESLMAEADIRLNAAREAGRQRMRDQLPHPPVKAKRRFIDAPQDVRHRDGTPQGSNDSSVRATSNERRALHATREDVRSTACPGRMGRVS